MMEIKSRANEKFKTWLDLTETKGIKKHNAFILSGAKLISEAYSLNKKVLAHLGYEEKSLTNYFCLSKDLLKELSPNQKAEELLILPTPVVKAWSVEDPIPKNSIFLPIGDPANLGACIRSAAAFGIKNIILLKEAASPFLAKSVKAASGAIWLVDFYSGPSIHELDSIAANIYALDKSGKSISKISPDKAFLVGEEGQGIPKFNFEKIAIPMSNEVESLNANVAAAIFMYERSKKL